MKVLTISLVILTAFTLANARGDFTVVQKVEGKGETHQITLKIKGDKIRLEATPQMTLIVDGKTGDTITLMNTQKKIVRISGDKAKAIAELTAKYGGGTSGKPKLVATGKKMEVNGYEAEEYLAESKQFKARYWIAPTFPNAEAVLKQLQAVVPAVWNDLAKGMIDYRDLPGLPIRTEMTIGDDEIISTLVAVKTDLLNDAEFFPPKDFQEMKIPNVQEMRVEKPEPKASAKP
jgi:hypothetical protein